MIGFLDRSSLMPAFEIGLWNAWIFLVLMLVVYYIPYLLIRKDAIGKLAALRTGSVPLSRTERISTTSAHNLVMPFVVVYSVFLPLKLGTVWFYAGLPICLLALAVNLMAAIDFATAPLDEPITKGVYRISRHPMYFGIFLLLIGIGIACASWVFLLCAAAWITLWHVAVPAEERYCINRYGNRYREYRNRTPRWIGMPKSRKRRPK